MKPKQVRDCREPYKPVPKVGAIHCLFWASAFLLAQDYYGNVLVDWTDSAKNTVNLKNIKTEKKKKHKKKHV